MKKLVFLTILVFVLGDDEIPSEEEETTAQNFMEKLEPEYLRRQNIGVEASWKYESNITEYNLEIKEAVSAVNAKYSKVKI